MSNGRQLPPPRSLTHVRCSKWCCLLLCSPREDIADAKERAAAEEAANKDAQKAAMARVTAESAKVIF